MIKILYFYTTWCGPALKLKELLRRLEPVGKYPLEIRYIDADKRPALKKKYKVKIIPTVVFLKKDREAERVAGAWHLGKFQGTLAKLKY
jgi:thiol-disulfide isomerase/thioredoxin